MTDPATPSDRTDRVQIDAALDDFYNELAGREGDGLRDLESAPFTTKKDVFVYAACVGQRLGQRQPLPDGKKVTIRRDVLKNDDVALLQALALAETGDVRVLERFEDVLDVVEEFAQVGIHELYQTLVGQGGKPLWNLADMVQSVTGATGEGQPS